MVSPDPPKAAAQRVARLHPDASQLTSQYLARHVRAGFVLLVSASQIKLDVLRHSKPIGPLPIDMSLGISPT